VRRKAWGSNPLRTSIHDFDREGRPARRFGLRSHEYLIGLIYAVHIMVCFFVVACCCRVEECDIAAALAAWVARRHSAPGRSYGAVQGDHLVAVLFMVTSIRSPSSRTAKCPLRIPFVGSRGPKHVEPAAPAQQPAARLPNLRQRRSIPDIASVKSLREDFFIVSWGLAWHSTKLPMIMRSCVVRCSAIVRSSGTSVVRGDRH